MMGMSESEREAIIQAWPFLGDPGGWTGAPLERGTNNRMFRLVAPAGGTYALRVAANRPDERRLRFEANVLTQLSRAGLPFALPTPIVTTSGAPFVEIPSGEASALATLTAFIPGEVPTRGDLAQAERAAEALAMLDVALARVVVDDDDAAVTWRTASALDQCHPLVPDPIAAIGELPISKEDRSQLIAGYEDLTARMPSLYASLPRQIIHEDLATSNVLMDAARVTGVLDFEFCSLDVRVMDLTVALIWWPVAHYGTGKEWPIIAALARGYGRAARLAPEEIAAIPTLFRLRTYSSLIHRYGRHLQGLSPMEAVIERADTALAHARWLRQNSARLVNVVATASALEEES